MTNWTDKPEYLIACREQRLMQQRVREKCPEAKHYEPYDWCNLSDNVCIRNTGNKDFDVTCEYYDDFLKEVNNG